MTVRNQADDIITSLFDFPQNKTNFQLFYKFLNQPTKGLSLCQVLPDEREKIFEFFNKDVLNDRIQRIDMVKPLLGPMELQITILDLYKQPYFGKKIFFIYNFESCIYLSKTTPEFFFRGMNMVRDFFMQFNAIFIFFVSEAYVKKMIQNAFDFYDWMKFTFIFEPERQDLPIHPLKAIKREETKYSNPEKKIAYLKKSIGKASGEMEKSCLLFDLGVLQYQINDYDGALVSLLESLQIEEKFGDLIKIAIRHQQLSQIYHDKGELQKALECAHKAVDIFEKNGVPKDLALSYMSIGRIYQDKRDWDKALESYFKVLEIFNQENDRENLSVVYANMGRIYRSKGDAERADNSFKYASAAEKDDFNWDELLSQIHHKNVIPVIGQGLYRVEIESEGKTDVLLYDYLADQLADVCGMSIDPHENHRFAKACREFLIRDIDDPFDELSKFIMQRIKGICLVPHGSLWKMARIKSFDFLMTTAQDNFLVDTINSVRSIPTKILSYSLNNRRSSMLSDELADSFDRSQLTVLFHIFGNVSNDFGNAYTERYILESVLNFGFDYMRYSNIRLLDMLRRKSFLFIGCGYDDWFYRLFIRSISQRPFVYYRNDSPLFVADDFGTADNHTFRQLPKFLSDHGIEVFLTGDSRNFVNLLFEKYENLYPEDIIHP